MTAGVCMDAMVAVVADERDRYVIQSRTFHEAAEYAAEMDWWLHSWQWEEADCELRILDHWCDGWRDSGWYCKGGHELVREAGLVACPTWPTFWRHPLWYFRMHWR